MTTVLSKWLSELLEFVLPAAAPKRRRGLASTIHGHSVDLAALCRGRYLSIFFLLQ
jgi:hypothetical protein